MSQVRRVPYRRLAACALWAAAVCVTVGVPSAQQTGHLNAVVEKLSRGERVFGVSTYDLSLENARALARADIDYVYVDMEHGPMDFGALQTFLLGMTDKAALHESGSLRQRVTPLARLAPYGREQTQWTVKQALDLGLMGIIFPSIETLRPLAPVVGLASLAVAVSAFWRRESLAVATVALAFATAIAYLNATMLPHLDPLLSPRALARHVQENGAADSVSSYRLHRAWDFGLDYYLKRDLPEWALGDAVLPALVATNDSGIEALREQGVSVEILEHVSREGVLVRVSRPAIVRAPASAPVSTSARAPVSAARAP